MTRAAIVVSVVLGIMFGYGLISCYKGWVAYQAREARHEVAEARADNAEAIAEALAGRLRQCEADMDRRDRPLP